MQNEPLPDQTTRRLRGAIQHHGIKEIPPFGHQKRVEEVEVEMPFKSFKVKWELPPDLRTCLYLLYPFLPVFYFKNINIIKF